MNRKIFPFCLLLLISGCASVEMFNQDEPPEYIVSRQAEFFRNGPAQAFPPEKINKDTHLNVLKKDSGFAFVRLLDKRTGYIAWSELHPAPPPVPEVLYDPVSVDEIVEVPLPDFTVVPDELPEKHRKQ
jgi:uncharacterized protein YgiM (DUF1202 family)